VPIFTSKDFCWNNEVWTEEKILSLEDKGKTGYLFKFDLEYPGNLHDLHHGYALASENLEIKNEMLNYHFRENLNDNKVNKLIITFNDKTSYGVNYQLLKLYIQFGLRIKKVNRVLQYTQSNFMESYIIKNINERKNSKNGFEKDFFKLKSNSMYGKIMKNERNRINFKLV